MSARPFCILLATCNGARFLPALLDSLGAQTDRDWIALVRDDGSADETPAILEAFAARDARLSMVGGEPGRLGIRDNFGRLLESARARECGYFALCDQDDVWQPDKIARMRAALAEGEARHGASTPLLAYADLALIDPAGRIIAGSHFARAGAASVRTGVDSWLLAHNLVPGCAMVGNRALLDLAMPFPPPVFHHDWWLVLVAAAAGHVIAVDAVLTGYRQHAGNAIGAASPLRRATSFLYRLGPSLADARTQYDRAVAQASALLDRLGDSGHAEWRLAALAVCDGLGARRACERIKAVVTGPVRRYGLARNVLMLAVSLFGPRRPPLPPDGRRDKFRISG